MTKSKAEIKALAEVIMAIAMMALLGSLSVAIALDHGWAIGVMTFIVGGYIADCRQYLKKQSER